VSELKVIKRTQDFKLHKTYGDDYSVFENTKTYLNYDCYLWKLVETEIGTLIRCNPTLQIFTNSNSLLLNSYLVADFEVISNPYGFNTELLFCFHSAHNEFKDEFMKRVASTILSEIQLEFDEQLANERIDILLRPFSR